MNLNDYSYDEGVSTWAYLGNAHTLIPLQVEASAGTIIAVAVSVQQRMRYRQSS